MSAEERTSKAADKVASAVTKYSDYILMALGVFGALILLWLIWRYMKTKDAVKGDK